MCLLRPEEQSETFSYIPIWSPAALQAKKRRGGKIETQGGGQPQIAFCLDNTEHSDLGDWMNTSMTWTPDVCRAEAEQKKTTRGEISGSERKNGGQAGDYQLKRADVEHEEILSYGYRGERKC